MDSTFTDFIPVLYSGHMNEIILGAILLGVPTIVTGLTGALKSLPTYAYLSDAERGPAVRMLAAGISLICVLITQWVTGSFDGNVLSSSVQVLILTGSTWFASLGIFHGLFQKR